MFVWQKGDLNCEQEAAVRAEESVFLMACPGSGKTRALTYKIAKQLSHLESARQWVVAITYTHRAADEIHERIERLGVDTSQLWIGTIHSFCLEWIIKPYSIYHPDLRNGFRIINQHDVEKIQAELCEAYRAARISHWDCNYYFCSEGRISNCQEYKKPHVDLILDQYHVILQRDRKLDFELILKIANELMELHPVISRNLSSLFSYVLVDEYQDTKEIQYNILGMILRSGEGSVRAFIVGDPNQAIYGSLGGYAISAEEFGRISGIRFREMSLGRNYRSSERIVRYFTNFCVTPAAIQAVGGDRDYPSVVTYNRALQKDALEDELVRLVRHTVEELGIAPSEICILAPQWMPLASTTRRLSALLPQYQFDGPGMVPFSRDIENFWFKLSRIALSQAAPEMFVRRMRWVGEVLSDLQDAGIDIRQFSRRHFLRISNAIKVEQVDGLLYLEQYFNELFVALGIEFRIFPTLAEQYESFFDSSRVRIARLQADGTPYINEIAAFRRVFGQKNGITVSTIHGVKGAEYDVVIAYALLQGMVPNFGDQQRNVAANKLLYVIGSRARKNLHLISERGRMHRGGEYAPTEILNNCVFDYSV